MLRCDTEFAPWSRATAKTAKVFFLKLTFLRIPISWDERLGKTEVASSQHPLGRVTTTFWCLPLILNPHNDDGQKYHFADTET